MQIVWVVTFAAITAFNYYIIRKSINRQVERLYDFIDEYDNYVDVHGHFLDDEPVDKPIKVDIYTPQTIKVLI